MKKRILAVLLLVAMLLSMLAACGGETNTPETQGNQGGSNTPVENNNQGGEDAPQTVGNFAVPEGGYDGSAVTITFYHSMGAALREVLDLYIAEFNALYPNITVVYETFSDYDAIREQISTQITVGNQPNIAYCYPDHVALYNLAQAVTTLDELIASQETVTRADGTTEILGLTAEQQADFIEGYYNEGKAFGDGLMYLLPMSKSTEVLYYNKTFFEENNIPVPTTWDEMEAVCAQIKAIDPESIPLGYDSEANWFITMCEQYGSPYTSASGDHYLFNNETNRAFVKKFNEWYQKGYLTTQELFGNYTSGLFTTLEGTRSYMSIGSSAGAKYQRPELVNGAYPFEVGITTIPQVDASNPKVISQGPSLCIFQKENPQEVIASWLFVKFLTTNVDFQVEFGLGGNGYMPVLKSAMEHPVFAEELSKADGGDYITALVIKVAMSQQHAYYTSPAFNGSSEARVQVGAMMAKCLPLTGSNIDAEIETAFEDAVAECEYHG